MMDYQPLVECWTPPLFERLEPRELEFGEFRSVKETKELMTGRVKFIEGRPSAWHVLTQKNGGLDHAATALCGVVGLLRSVVTLNEKAFEVGHYRMHTCIDCYFMLNTQQSAPDKLFDNPALKTFDNRKI